MRARLLIVEADPASFRAAILAAGACGAEVVEAKGYASAVAALMGGGLTAVVAGQRIDESRTGLDLLRDMNLRTDRTPFILVRSPLDYEVGEEALGLGAADVVSRPVGAERLAAALKRASAEKLRPSQIPPAFAENACLCDGCGVLITGDASACSCPPGTDLIRLHPRAVSVNQPPVFPDRRFVLNRLLGRTGFSEVWGGWQIVPRRRAVVKFPLAEEPDDLERFKREARVQSTLQHPSIPAVYDLSLGDPAHMYFASEFVVGRHLDEISFDGTADPALRVRRTLHAAAQVALALDYLHSRSLLHRDVKPQNILASPDGRAWLIDYGLARSSSLAGSVTAELKVLGTLPFMSPEQTIGRRADLDGRSDIWSLGATLYYLLTGAYPFEGMTFGEVAQRIQTTVPVPPRKRNERISEALDGVVMKALARKKDDRWKTAGEMAEALGKLTG